MLECKICLCKVFPFSSCLVMVVKNRIKIYIHLNYMLRQEGSNLDNRSIVYDKRMLKIIKECENV